jgi:hypothetical protein
MPKISGPNGSRHSPVLIMFEDLKLSRAQCSWTSSDIKSASRFDRIFTDRMWHLNVFYLLTQAELVINWTCLWKWMFWEKALFLATWWLLACELMQASNNNVWNCVAVINQTRAAIVWKEMWLRWRLVISSELGSIVSWRLVPPRLSRPASEATEISNHFVFILQIMCGTGSSICIATGYRLDGPGIESRWGSKFSALVQTDPGAHPASCTMAPCFFRG